MVSRSPRKTAKPPVETIPSLVIELDDETGVFKAHAQANQFLFTRHIDELSVPGYTALKAVTVLVLDQVLDEERPRLENFLAVHGRDPQYPQKLYNALEKCWGGETNLPLESASNSPELSSVPETGPESKDASSSEGTDEFPLYQSEAG